MTRQLSFYAALLLLALVGIFLGWSYLLSSNQPVPSIEERVAETINGANEAFTSNGKSAIEVSSVSRHNDKWLVATIYSTLDEQRQVAVKLVLLDTGNELKIIAGPDTYFSEREILSLNVPDSVIVELQKQ